MPQRRSTVAFRRDNDLVLHKLIPHACAYSVALNEGDAPGCEDAMEAMAALLLADIKMPARPPRTAPPPSVAPAGADNVTRLEPRS